MRQISTWNTWSSTGRLVRGSHICSRWTNTNSNRFSFYNLAIRQRFHRQEVCFVTLLITCCVGSISRARGWVCVYQVSPGFFARRIGCTLLTIRLTHRARGAGREQQKRCAGHRGRGEWWRRQKFTSSANDEQSSNGGEGTGTGAQTTAMTTEWVSHLYWQPFPRGTPL